MKIGTPNMENNWCPSPPFLFSRQVVLENQISEGEIDGSQKIAELDKLRKKLIQAGITIH